MSKERAQKVDRGIRLVWESLETHLEGTHTLSSSSKKYIEEVGNEKFHKQCVKDYAELIKILSELY